MRLCGCYLNDKRNEERDAGDLLVSLALSPLSPSLLEISLRSDINGETNYLFYSIYCLVFLGTAWSYLIFNGYVEHTYIQNKKNEVRGV